MGCVARILSGGETPVGLIESGWLVPIPCGSGGCHPFYPRRLEGATLFDHLPANPLRSGWGLTRSNRLTHR